MSSIEGWKRRLEPIEEAYMTAVRTIIEHMDSMSPEDLLQFRDDLKRPTNTNCSWQMWAAKDIALMFINSTHERHRAKTS